MEIQIRDSFNLIIGNQYFPPDTNLIFIQSCLHYLESVLDTQHFRVVFIGIFNILNFDWKHSLSMNNCHNYFKQKGDAICASACVLRLSQRNKAEVGRNLLGLVFFTLMV
jgi:hypothetical protein